MSTGKTNSLIVTSGYGANTNSPFVQIESADLDKPIQLAPHEARAFAINLLEAAEAAESDGFLVSYFRDELKVTAPVMGSLLSQFRKWRNDHRKTTPPNEIPKEL